MATSITFNHALRGYLVGNLWQGCEAWKPMAYDITREDKRYTTPGSLRDHVLVATNDGDFVHAKLADCDLVTVATINRGGRPYQRVRVVSLEDCPTVSDMVEPHWAGPSLDDDDSGEG